jgi:hypothetical protein
MTRAHRRTGVIGSAMRFRPRAQSAKLDAPMKT